MIKSLVFDGKTYTQFEAERLLELGIPEAVVQQALEEQVIDTVRQQRRQAYAAESDRLFLEWQYDQTSETEQIWRDKVAEIKTRYPFPTPVADE